ncbi:hypothetical protein Zm00014a_022066 [Zea mays]|uniref:CCR4-NOT transcription complex subunit 1 CAF1-binding domain-containing protein n=1 Tax=Zea mays TaxID=4577 RepID=A0A3L6FFZ2_MAIZE|nr:hypothetical protein Zm00014a_022066 [Zea mays]
MAQAAAGGKDRDGVGGGRGGSWLGKFTIGRNQALRAKEIDPKSLIVEAYEKGLMIAVIPFTSKALHWRTGHKNDCLQIISSSAASNSVLPTIGKVPANTSWPEFEIKIDYEGIFDSDSGDENNSKLLVMQRHGKPDAMMQSWMDQFEADSDNKCWTSFQERVSRAPNQVLRYCREPNAKRNMCIMQVGQSS